MSDDDIRKEMTALAQSLMAAEPKLSLTAAGLRKVEAGFARLHKKHGARAVGAFLGEVVVARGAGAVRWVTFETAAAADRQIAKLGKDDETSAVLAVGGTHWFPHVKVAKRKRNGPSDSLVAFEGVVLSRAASPDEDADEPAPAASSRSRSSKTGVDFPADTRKAAEAFRRAPSSETLRAFNEKVSPNVYQEHYKAFFVQLGLRAAPFLALLALPDEGRGLKRWSASGIAADWVVHLLETGVEPATCVDQLRPLLADPSERARQSAARILMQAAIRRQDFAEAQELARSTDKAILRGAFRGLAAQLSRGALADEPKRTKRFDPSPLGPILKRGLAGDPALIEETLGIIGKLVASSDLSAVLPPALGMLNRPEPGLVESALHLVKHYAFSVVHGQSPYLPILAKVAPKVIALTRAKTGAQKVTRVQIAARYALSPLEKLEPHFDAKTREAVRKGLEAAKHIR